MLKNRKLLYGVLTISGWLLFGLFNYGTKGILDVTHKRLFTLRTFQNLMEQTGFLVVRKRFFPFPFDMVGLPVSWCGVLQKIHQQLIAKHFVWQILIQTLGQFSLRFQKLAQSHFTWKWVLAAEQLN